MRAREIFNPTIADKHGQISLERNGIVDGREVSFELVENVTQKPQTDRETRLKFSVVNVNCKGSPPGVKIPWIMMRFGIPSLSLLYLASFLSLNVVFAGLFHAASDGCCGDPDMTFSQVFDFAVQTSTTIGYGGSTPAGYYANFLVVMLSYLAVLLNTVFAGLLFLKFVTPTAQFEFSDVVTLSNINGLPCLQIRVGNADGQSNPLTNISARLTYSYLIEYKDPHGQMVTYGTTEDLRLVNNRRDTLDEVWTIRHEIDESSPLFGLNFQEYPGSCIFQMGVSVGATQELTKMPVTAHTVYQLQNILVGHVFEDQIRWDNESRVVTCDFSKLNETRPSPVWYPKAATTQQ